MVIGGSLFDSEQLKSDHYSAAILELCGQTNLKEVTLKGLARLPQNIFSVITHINENADDSPLDMRITITV